MPPPCCRGLIPGRKHPLPVRRRGGLLFLQEISSKGARNPLRRAGFAAAEN